MVRTETAISLLVTTRARAIGITTAELVSRCGFRNVSKGLRRLEEVCAGEFSHSQFLLTKLPDALSLKSCVIEAAIRETIEEKQRLEDQHYCEAFRPHALITCERQIPEPIWLAAMIGTDKLLRIDFEDGSPPISFIRQALEGLRNKLVNWNAQVVPAFGSPRGVVVNYTPDRAVEFDPTGMPLRVMDRAVRIDATVKFKGVRLSDAEIAAWFGSR